MGIVVTSFSPRGTGELQKCKYSCLRGKLAWLLTSAIHLDFLDTNNMSRESVFLTVFIHPPIPQPLIHSPTCLFTHPFIHPSPASVHPLTHPSTQ